MKTKIKKVAIGKTKFVEEELLKKPKMETVMKNKVPKIAKFY